MPILLAQVAPGWFFAYVLPWLLTFAVSWGLLDHYMIPRSRISRLVISIVLATLALGAGPMLGPAMIGIAKGFAVVAAGILTIIIFVELLGYKAGGTKNIFELHPRAFGAIMIILGILIFFGSGAAGLLGLQIPAWELPPFAVPESALVVLFFLAVIIIGMYIIVAKGE